MTITATIIKDSISPQDIRLTTFLLRYPRFIHAELMTHRMFSRNASSSRAIPVERLIEDVINDTAMPIHWGANQAGMQAQEECDSLIEYYGGEGDLVKMTNKKAWLEARDQAIAIALAFSKAGYHKQIVNRLLEPFSHINVVVSATDYQNFYKLRAHKDAQPEIHQLAVAMIKAQQESVPNLLEPGEWHLPFVYDEEHDLTLEQRQAISVARCARTSYLTHDARKTTVEQDLALMERLMGTEPLHASPAEHQATPAEYPTDTFSGFYDESLHGNFTGWIQYRKTFENEFTPG